MFRRLIQAVLLALLALLALAFGALNPEPVDLKLAFIGLTLPLGLALVITLVIGLLTGIAWRVTWVAQLLAERGRLRRALRDAESRSGKELVATPDARS